MFPRSREPELLPDISVAGYGSKFIALRRLTNVHTSLRPMKGTYTGTPTCDYNIGTLYGLCNICWYDVILGHTNVKVKVKVPVDTGILNLIWFLNWHPGAL